MPETERDASPASLTVLLVDDDADDIWLVDRMFRKAVPEGHRLNVVAKMGGTAALEWIGEAQSAGRPMPDLIVLDINMPGLSGLDLLTVFRARPMFLATPILVLTTSNEREMAVQARQAGANALLTKPDTMDKLEALLRDVCGRWLSLSPPCDSVPCDTSARRQAAG